MPKNTYVLLDLIALNLCHAADCFHAGGLLQALAMATLAFLHTGEVVMAIWCIAFAAALASALLRTISVALAETKRQLGGPFGASASTQKRARRRSPTRKRTPAKGATARKPKTNR